MNLQTLETARQKLQETDVPFQLRAIYYIRLSCLVLDSHTLTYSSLLQALTQQRPDWWQMCSVSATGELQSADAAIAALLQPITRLHQPPQPEVFALPLVA